MNTEELDLRAYLKVLQKRRWTVISVFLAVVLTVTAANFMATPIYRATAKVYIQSSLTDQYALQQSSYYVDNTSYIQTQMSILKSESIARKVISKLGLNRSGGDALNVDDCIGSFLGSLKVDAEKNSDIVMVSYEDKDPVIAAKVVNETVQTYIEQNLEMKVTPARDAMKWLNDRLTEIKTNMQASSSNLQEFKHEQGLIVTGDKQSNISLLALSDLNAKVLAASSRRYEAENKYHQVQNLANNTAALMTLPAVMNDKVIQDLKVQQSQLDKQIAEQSKKLGEKHPQMVRLRNEKESLDRQIRNEVDLVVAALKNDYEEALRTEKSIRNALSQQKSEAMNYEKRSAEYDLKMQDVEGSRQIYDAVLKKFQETNLMGSINLSNVQLLDRAMPPKMHIRPNKRVNILIGIMLGLFTGVGLAFFVEYIDNTYKSSEDVEEHLALPFLGVVPSHKPLRGKTPPERLIVIDEDNSHMAEFFRNIWGNILLSTGDLRPKVIQVCSALQSEGKSLVSTNLSCIMAGAGEKVLLIDGDLRRPVLHRTFGVTNNQGLSNILTHQASLESVIRPTGTRNLDIITSGPVSPNPGELLGSKGMKEVMSLLRERYDRIIIDCPPSIGITDSSFLSPLSDGVILVIRSGKTPREIVMKAKKGFDVINAKILGVVLNDLHLKSAGHQYHLYNYDRYRKGDEARTE